MMPLLLGGAMLLITLRVARRRSPRIARLAGLIFLTTSGFYACTRLLPLPPRPGPWSASQTVMTLTLPWTVFLPGWIALRRTGAGRRRSGPAWLRGLMLAVLLVLPFTAEAPYYLLPVLALLSLGVAEAFDHVWESADMPRWVERGVAALIVLHAAALWAIKRPFALPIFPYWDAAPGDLVGLGLGLSVFILVGVWGMRKPAYCFGGVCASHAVILFFIGAHS